MGHKKQLAGRHSKCMVQTGRGHDYHNQGWELAVGEGFQEEALLKCWLNNEQREQAKARMA